MADQNKGREPTSISLEEIVRRQESLFGSTKPAAGAAKSGYNPRKGPVIVPVVGKKKKK